MSENTEKGRNARRTLQGVVVSDKAQNTITVAVDRTFKHPRYGKFLRKRKKYMAHDQENTARRGDTVEIAATRPLSKHKRWRLVQVTNRAILAHEAGISPDRELAEAAGGDE